MQRIIVYKYDSSSEILIRCDLFGTMNTLLLAVKHPHMVWWVVGSIPHGEPISCFSFQPMLHSWCNKDNGMCYTACGMMHTKGSLLLIGSP